MAARRGSQAAAAVGKAAKTTGLVAGAVVGGAVVGSALAVQKGVAAAKRFDEAHHVHENVAHGAIQVAPGAAT